MGRVLSRLRLLIIRRLAILKCVYASIISGAAFMIVFALEKAFAGLDSWSHAAGIVSMNVCLAVWALIIRDEMKEIEDELGRDE